MLNRPSILFRVDDAGVALSRNTAIESALRAGVARSVSWMACAPHAREAAERLLRIEGDFCIGLHATVNAEWDCLRWGPVAGAHRVPTLVLEDGTFSRSPMDLHGKFALEDIETEIRAQIALGREYGLGLAYLDTHMGFDWLPGAADLLQRVAQEEGLLFGNGCPLEPVPPEVRAASLSHPGDGSVFSSLSPKPYLWVFHPQGDPGDSPRLMLSKETDETIVANGAAERRFLVNPLLAKSLRSAGISLLSYLDFRDGEREATGSFGGRVSPSTQHPGKR